MSGKRTPLTFDRHAFEQPPALQFYQDAMATQCLSHEDVQGMHLVPCLLKKRHFRREWFQDDANVAKIILAAFPTWEKHPTEKRRAARWVEVIRLYFRAGEKATVIAEELGITVDQVRSTVRAVKRRARGLASNGARTSRVRRGKHRRHHEKRQVEITQAVTDVNSVTCPIILSL